METASNLISLILNILTILFFNVYLFLRERDREEAGEGQREGDRIGTRLWSCQHRARRWAGTHELQDHDLSQSQTLNQPSHRGAPILFFKDFIFLSNLYTQHGARTHNPKMKIHAVHQPSQPGTPASLQFSKQVFIDPLMLRQPSL